MRSEKRVSGNQPLEELDANQWIALLIQRLSSQSEHAKNTIHCFSIY